MANYSDDLVVLLQEQERAAISFRDTTLADDQANAIDYYEAKPFGDEQEGRSQVVAPEVAEVVDYAQISILRTCVSGDRVVEFEPGDIDDAPEDQEQLDELDRGRTAAADDATQAVNHIFMRKQNGYRILLDWLQSGLIEKVGIIKTAYEVKKRKVTTRMLVDEMQLTMMIDQEQPIKQATDNGDGTWTIAVEEMREQHCYPDYPIPSEEFLFSAQAKDEDSGDYYAHRCHKPKSELIEMGFDRALVESLPNDDSAYAIDDARSLARWDDEEGYDDAPTMPGMERVWLLEEYVRADIDGDGIAELVKVFRVGDVIFETEEVDENPFVVWTPFPRAHRLVGNSMAEKVMDIQRIMSALLRQALDGTYQTNAPRMWLDENSITNNTIDDLLTVRPGGIVRSRGAKPEPLHESFDINKSLGMIEYFIGARETRTGITRLNQGIDADTLNKTASGQAQLQATGQQIEEFVARNFAEAMARLFAKKLRLMRDNGHPIAIKVDGVYRRIDPTLWDDDLNVCVRVGLGTGRKEQRLVYRREMLELQREGLQIGLSDPGRIYNNVSALVRDAGLGNPDDYFVDPATQEQPPQPQPTPEEMQAQSEQQKMLMEAQQKQAEAEARAQEAAAKIELMREEAAAKLELQREEAAAQIQLARDKAAAEADLARQRMDFEIAMARENAQREYQLALQKIEVAKDVAGQQATATPAVTIRKNRPGGDLDK